MSYAILNDTKSDSLVSYLKKNGFTIVDTTTTFNKLTDGKFKQDMARAKRKEYYSRPDVQEKRKAYMDREDVKQKRKEYAKRPDVVERKKKIQAKRRKLLDLVREKDPETFQAVMLADTDK